MDATTTAEPRVSILGLSCGGCDFHYEIENPIDRPLVPRSYLRDWTWEHWCGGQIAWTVEPGTLTLATLTAVVDALNAGVMPAHGLPGFILDEITRHRIEAGAS